MTELTLQQLRSLGGKAVLKKYGREYFAELGRKSAKKKKEKAATSK